MASRYPLNGFDECRFETAVSDELKCCICSKVLNNPRGCPNKHFFCHNCIIRHLQNVDFCPVCRETLTPDTLQDPPRALTRSLSELRIHCDYQRQGCEVVVSLGDLQTHVDAKCEFNPDSPACSGLFIRFGRSFGPKLFSSMEPEHVVSGHSLDTEPSLKRMQVATESPGKPSQPPRRLMEKHDFIVIGRRGQDGQSLKSVERFIFREGRWIELPPMNTARSFAASVLVDNQIVVSGGDTITDSIEILNLDETPLQWITSPAKLRVPLSAHRTVAYQGKLIVIGGNNHRLEAISEMIFEVLLTPPYSTNILRGLPRRRAWHGAELVNDKIFIFGGGSTPITPQDDVFLYDPRANECSEMAALPYPVQGMATVRWGNKVLLLGGVNEREEELDDVISYDTESGETTRLPRMTQKRGGCCAVNTPTVDTSSACSSDTSTDTLVALASLRSLNTVERYDFHSHAWQDMPPTREAREFCTAVVSPVNFELEQ
jgi:hypothetical protein